MSSFERPDPRTYTVIVEVVVSCKGDGGEMVMLRAPVPAMAPGISNQQAVHDVADYLKGQVESILSSGQVPGGAERDRIPEGNGPYGKLVMPVHRVAGAAVAQAPAKAVQAKPAAEPATKPAAGPEPAKPAPAAAEPAKPVQAPQERCQHPGPASGLCGTQATGTCGCGKQGCSACRFKCPGAEAAKRAKAEATKPGDIAARAVAGAQAVEKAAVAARPREIKALMDFWRSMPQDQRDTDPAHRELMALIKDGGGRALGYFSYLYDHAPGKVHLWARKHGVGGLVPEEEPVTASPSDGGGLE